MQLRTVVFASLSLLASCSADRAGWAPRGSFFKLHESPTVQVRRGTQYVDRATGEMVLHWVGARAVEGAPYLLACELVLFDDKDGDGKASPGEILLVRESLTPTRKVLFDDVRAVARPDARVRVRFRVRTEAEICDVVWDFDRD